MSLLRSIVGTVILSVSIFYLLYAPALSIFPQNDTEFEFIPITNNEEYLSATQASMDVAHGHLHFRYTLDSTIANPYAVLLLHAHELERTVNLSTYDELIVEVDPQDCSDFTITLYLYEEGISDMSNMETHRPLSIKCRTKEGKKVYTLPLSKFATPHDWYRFMGYRPEEVPPPSWSNVSHLAFAHFDKSQAGSEQALTISRLEFRDVLWGELCIVLLSALLIFEIMRLFERYFKQKKNRKIKQRIYYAQKQECKKDSKSTLLTFFHKEYANPLFSQHLIEKELGFKPVVVNDLLLNEVGSTYKQYLNQLRIDKAKYLLTESDLTVSSIATEVGYCYANSFSRAFRNIVGCTPVEYRKEH